MATYQSIQYKKSLDISEQFRTLEDVHQSIPKNMLDERFKAICFNDSIYLTKVEGAIMRWDPIAEDISHLLGGTPWELEVIVELKVVFDYIVAITESGEIIRSVDGFIFSSIGSVGNVSVSTPALIAGDDVTGYFIINPTAI